MSMPDLVVRSTNTASSLISVAIPDDLHGFLRSDRQAGGPVGVTLRERGSGRIVSAQYDPPGGRLWFVLHDPAGVGGTWHLETVELDRPPAALPASFLQKLDRVELSVAGAPFASYVVSGTRRPYFWPVLGPAGTSVVRGQGSSDHPHHTGLALNYGGHAEGGSVNLWSDWDEPPYGPGGRMLHRGFRRALAGPVYGEIVEDLTYVDAYGDPFASEVRTVRWWWSSPTCRFLDFEVQIVGLSDRGTSPFLMMMRAADCFDVPDVGHVTNAAGAPVPGRVYTPESYFAASWVDMSGPTGEPPPPPPPGPPEVLVDLQESSARYRQTGSGPWNGIALFDHPSNHGYPATVGKYSTAQQVTLAHYPPDDTGSFTIYHRVLVHDGDATSSGVAAYASDYRSDPAAEFEQPAR